MAIHYGVEAKCAGAALLAAKFHEDNDTDVHSLTALSIGRPCPKCNGAGCGKCNGCGCDRGSAKAIFLGLCYGEGGAKLCRDLGLPTKFYFNKRMGKRMECAGPEGQAIIDKFDLLVPFVRALAKKASMRGRKNGFIRTISGRRCRFPRDDAGRIEWTHKALNRLIQGSAADQTKAAMVAADAAGYPLQLQVHDELDLSVENVEEARALAEIMLTTTPLHVPSKVDIEMGPSWGEAKGI